MELNSYGSAVQMLKTCRLNCILRNMALMESQHVDSRQLEEFPAKAVDFKAAKESAGV